jgi:predicted PurR-regulated permease PerM
MAVARTSLTGQPAPRLEDRAFLLLLVAVSVAFAWVIWPLSGAILWGTIGAIVFAPLNRRLCQRLRGGRTLAALLTVALVVLIVILPLTVLGALLVNEAADMYARLRSGELSPSRYFEQVVAALPAWAVGVLARFGLTDLGAVQERLSSALVQGSQAVAARALAIGQRAFGFVVSFFVMLYLLFFLLRDGDALARRIAATVPLAPERRRELVERFTEVVRSTIKVTIVIALAQGTLGGLIFWLLGIQAPLLWAAVMAVLSLVPAIGPALVWLPVAAYLLATGAVWQGVVLIAYGVLVIGLVDNLVRPVLVGNDTRMPDYVVLVATLGGLAIFGANGIVLGPMVAALFMAAWDIFARTRRAGSEVPPGG